MTTMTTESCTDFEDGRSGRTIPVLLYHSVSNEPSPAIEPFTVSPDAFERHLDLIEQAGAQTLTVSDLVDRLSGEGLLPPHPVVITFDDGFADTLDIAAPMLWRRGMVATAYLTTGYLAGGSVKRGLTPPGDMLSWDRLSELESCRLELGAHTHAHPQLDVLSHAAAAAEMRVCRVLLETSLCHRVRSFAYPHGYASPWLRAEARQAGFDSACGVRNALSHADDDRWCIARLTVQAGTRDDRIAAWLRGHGAPVAGRPDRVLTRAWRAVRRARYVMSSRSDYRGWS